MADDAQCIFTLKPINLNASRAFQRKENERYRPRHPDAEKRAIFSSQTPSANISNARLHASCLDSEPEPELCFRFDMKPKNIREGFVFGNNPEICDVVLGGHDFAISKKHFRITFDDQDQLVLIDSSTFGTAVDYDGQGIYEKRSNAADRKQERPRNRCNDFKWILFPSIKHICIALGPDISPLPPANCLQMSIHVSKISQQTSNNKEKAFETPKERFLKEMRRPSPGFPHLNGANLAMSQSRPHVSNHKSHQRPIWIDQGLLGEGTYGKVYKAMDVSTGKIYAAKRFMGANSEEARTEWSREVEMLQAHQHRFIVEYVAYDAEKEEPRLIMEFLKLRSLRYQHSKLPLSTPEVATFFSQALEALTFLHQRKIMHRDLKPENILVESRDTQRRDASQFRIKLADFGTAKKGSMNASYRGTETYMAPELSKGIRYNNTVDVWSLGLIAFEFLHGLPNRPRDLEKHLVPKLWFPKLAARIKTQRSDQLTSFLADHMLREDPVHRFTAEECFRDSAKILQDIQPQREQLGVSGTTERAGRDLAQLQQKRKRSASPVLGHTRHREEKSLVVDPTGYVYVTVDGQRRLFLRTTDWYLNASEILDLAGISESEQTRIMTVIRENVDVAKDPSLDDVQAWIPLADGINLCEAVRIAGELYALLNYARTHSGYDGTKVNYDLKSPQYGSVEDGGLTIRFRLEDLHFDAEDIMHATQCSAQALQTADTNGDYDSLETICPRRYVGPWAAIKLCKSHSLHELARKLRQFVVKRGGRLPDDA